MICSRYVGAGRWVCFKIKKIMPFSHYTIDALLFQFNNYSIADVQNARHLISYFSGKSLKLMPSDALISAQNAFGGQEGRRNAPNFVSRFRRMVALGLSNMPQCCQKSGTIGSTERTTVSCRLFLYF